MKVLFVSRQPPLPLDNGGRIRTFHLVKELSKQAHVRYVGFDSQPGGGSTGLTTSEISAQLPSVAEFMGVPAPRKRKRVEQALSLVTTSSYQERLHRSTAMTSTIRRALTEFRPDVVHVESLFFAPALRAVVPSDTLTTLGPHNHESLLMRRLSETSSSTLRRALYAREAVAVERLERDLLPRFDCCIAVSPPEARAFAALGAIAACVPNGVGRQPPPRARAAASPAEPFRLLFVGTQDYEPNRLGLMWFHSDVLPLLSGTVPVDVTVAGAGKTLDLDSVRSVGRVEDLRPVYDQAHAVIVPLQAGGGSRLKVLEALALGTPLITTELGAEGFPLEHERHALIARSAREFAEGILALARNYRDNVPQINRQVAAGYCFASRYFWDLIGTDFSNVLGNLLAAKERN